MPKVQEYLPIRGFEILPQEDILESSHQSEFEEEAGLLFAEDEFTNKEDDILQS